MQKSIECIDAVLKLAHLIRKRMGRDYTRYQALKFLQHYTDVTQRRLAAHLDQNESSVSTLIGRMASDGLVQRKGDTKDRRRWLVIMTTRGTEALHDLTSSYMKHADDILHGKPEYFTSTLTKMLKDVHASSTHNQRDAG